MVKGVQTQPREAEAVRQRLLRDGVLHEEYKPRRDDDTVVFPVKDDYDGDTIDCDFERFKSTPSFKDAVEDMLTGAERDAFIHSYDVIGDIAIIQVPDVLEGKAGRIAERLLASKPNVNTVRRRSEERSGTFRLRETAHLAGVDKTQTTHVEHGVRISVDVNDVYFSPRLSTERGRIAGLVEDGERVLVMFSGCAPYPCVIAELAAPDLVVGVELNPAAHRHAVQSVDQNGFGDVIDLYQGDVDDVVPDLGVFDRVVMPAPHDALRHVSLLEGSVADGRAHIYSFVNTGRLASGDLGSDLPGEGVRTVRCGDRSPSETRVCFDRRLSEHG